MTYVYTDMLNVGEILIHAAQRHYRYRGEYQIFSLKAR